MLAESLPALTEAFAETYRTLYTRVVDDADIEVLSFRVRVSCPEPQIALSGAVAGNVSGAALKGHRPAYFDGRFHDTPVYDRYALAPGQTVVGPAIIEEREATTVIAPGDSVTVDAARNLRIAVAAAQNAQALVTPGMSLAQATALIEADPIGLEIMWSRLISIVEEMWQTVCRTAYSLIISESQDFANEILDPHGNPLAHSPRAMPLFNLTLTRCVQALLEHFPPDTLQPGDVLVTNDPWLCAGHLFDIALVTPVFSDGRLVALMGTVGHVSDIGGVKDPGAVRELFDEGVLIPPMKLYSAGQPDKSLLRMLHSNVRNPDQVLGDIESMITANALGGQRLLAFMAEYGLEDLAALAAVVRARSEAATRAAIRAVPDGVYESELDARPIGEELLRFKVRVHKKDDTIHIEHVDPPPEVLARRRELHHERHRGAFELPGEVHADPERARQRRLLCAAHRHRVAAYVAQLRSAGGGGLSHPHLLVARAEPLSCAGAGHPGQGTGLHRHAQGVRLLRPQPAGPRRLGPLLHGRWAGCLAAPGRQVRPAVPDLGRQHAGRAAGEPHARGDPGEDRWSPTPVGPARGAAASASACGRGGWKAARTRSRSASSRKATASMCRACSVACRAAGRSAS